MERRNLRLNSRNEVQETPNKGKLKELQAKYTALEKQRDEFNTKARTWNSKLLNLEFLKTKRPKEFLITKEP